MRNARCICPITMVVLPLVASFAYAQGYDSGPAIASVDRAQDQPYDDAIMYDLTFDYPVQVDACATDAGAPIGHLLRFFLDQDGRYSFDELTRLNPRTRDGELAFDVGTLTMRSDRTESTHTKTFRASLDHFDGMPLYVYGYRYSQLGCDHRSEVGNVYVIPPPDSGKPREFCPVTPTLPCQLHVTDASAAPTAQGQCTDCSQRCLDIRKRIEDQLNSTADCSYPGGVCGVYTWYKTQGAGGIRDTLGEFIDACFAQEPVSGARLARDMDTVTLEFESSDPAILRVLDAPDRVSLERVAPGAVDLWVSALGGSSSTALLSYHFRGSQIPAPALPIVGLWGLLLLLGLGYRRVRQMTVRREMDL